MNGIIYHGPPLSPVLGGYYMLRTGQVVGPITAAPEMVRHVFPFECVRSKLTWMANGQHINSNNPLGEVPGDIVMEMIARPRSEITVAKEAPQGTTP